MADKLKQTSWDDYVQFDGVSLAIAPGMPIMQWEELGAYLFAMHDCIQFAICAWAEYGQRAYGVDIDDIAEQFGRAPKTIRNYLAVYHAYPPASRCRELEFGHFEAAAVLPHKQRETLLNEAQEQGWTVHQTRWHKHRLLEENGDKPPTETCPTCGGKGRILRGDT